MAPADRNTGGAEPSTVAQTQLPGALHLPGIRLSVLEGPNRGAEVKARRGTVRVGTAPENDLVLADDSVSRRHLEVRLGRDEVRVRDLGSTNGTTVDGVRVIEALLSAASLIRLGNTTIRVTPLDETVTVALSVHDRFGALLGASTAMREVFGVLERVAPTDASVIIEGETGTGKEVAAEAIHMSSARADGPFLTVDCGAVPAALMESELFGHVRGAFTGATGDRRGVFEEANGGTVFLDELGELPLELQPKLLRVLEAREVRRVGETHPRPVDVRIIAATNRDLVAEVNRRTFREDLYFRLAVVCVRLPPLRARREDIPMLVKHFVGCFAPGRPDLAAELVPRLLARPFPGNVRELRNSVQRALALGEAGNGGAAPAAGAALGGADFGALLELPYKEALQRLTERFEKAHIERALRVSGGSVSGAARLAGLSRRYVQTLMTRHLLRGRSEAEDE